MMRILLACLMCEILPISQAFAIDGGPFGGAGGRVDVRGVYAAVLLPIPTVLSPGPPPVKERDNSLVLFTLTVPRIGLATGDTVAFRTGIAYSGTITGSVDPDSAKLTGVIAAEFEQTDIVLADGSKSIAARYEANGRFANAHITASTDSFSASLARIRGKASMTYKCIRSDNQPCNPPGDSGNPIEYRIHGFKQSQSVITTS
jgi:hypothetical protein